MTSSRRYSACPVVSMLDRQSKVIVRTEETDRIPFGLSRNSTLSAQKGQVLVRG